MRNLKDNELFDMAECNLLCDLVMERFIQIGEKDSVKHLFLKLINKIENLTRGTYGE